MDTAAACVRTWAPRRHASAWAAATLLMTAVGVAVAIVLLTRPSGTLPDQREDIVSSASYILSYGLVGAFLVRRRPDLPFGWLLAGSAAILAFSGATSGLAALAVHHGDTSALAIWGVTMGNLGFVQAGVQGLINVRFPTGKITTRSGRILDRLMITGLVFAAFAGLLGASFASQVAPDASSKDLDNPLTGGTALEHLADSLNIVIPLIVLLGLISGLRIVVLARRADGIERQQLQWRAFGVVLSLALFPFAIDEVLPSVTDILDGAVFVATLAIPVLRYRLWEIDTVIRRSAAYALVTVALVAGYVAIATVGAALASERVGFLVAAVAVATAYGPARTRSQRIVDHFFYGERDNPYQALSDVGRRLEAAAERGNVLSAVVNAVAESLRLPYVAIERPGDGELLAAYGDPRVDGVDRWPLTYQGVIVGVLVASPRRGETRLDDRDRVVLTDLARQSGAAVHAEALTADLIESRQRLVNAREEERRRLRRDLHDGLGPLLTGLGLNVDAARAQLESENRALTDTFLTRAKIASSQAITDLRGIVYGLRPPALDDLGLVGAIGVHVERLAEGSPLQVTVDAPELPELPAAVEVAAFRTAVEAVNNVIRHAGARECTVRLSVEDDRGLLIEVLDDGANLGPWRAGVGLLAMRERVVELGGDLIAGPDADGGRVRARFPLAVSACPLATR